MKSQYGMQRIVRWVLVGAGAFCGLSAGIADAETYIAGQVGYTLAQDATRLKTVDPHFAGIPAGTTVSNVNLNDSVMYGMKVGHYFESTPWLGVELEGFITNPHVPQQRLTLNVPGVGSVPADQPGATNRLIVIAPNLVARYRAGTFEPYVGIGPGIFLLHQNRDVAGASSYSQSSTSVGINTQVGLRAFVTDHISLFGEWKYNYFRVSLSGQADGQYFGNSAWINLHHFVFGVGYHF